MTPAVNGRSRSGMLLAPDGRTPARRELRNRYEAGSSQYRRQRTWLHTGVQDARADIDRGARTEVMRRVRYLWENSPTLAGILESMVVYTVGDTGVIPYAASSSKPWNKAANRTFQRWAMQPDLRHRTDLAGYQRVVARSMFLDGDMLSVLTSGESGRPRLAAVEAHRCTTPDTAKANKQEPDGIRLDANGRPAFYTIQTDGTGGDFISDGQRTFRKYRAGDIVHHLLRLRADQYRGISVFAAAVNTVHDLHDILEFEKQSVKAQATRIDILETASGEVDPEEALRAGTFPSECSTDQDDRVYYEETFGSEVKVLRNGDKFTPYTPARPSAAWQGFVDFLASSVCLSTGLPPSVLVPFTRSSGTDTRRDLARAARVFRQWQSDIAVQFQQVWNYVIDWESKTGELAGRKRPDDWWNVNWQLPKPIIVDYGREAQQDREDVRVGLTTLKDFCAKYSIDWTDHVRQLDEEAEYVKKTGEDLYQRLYVQPKQQNVSGSLGPDENGSSTDNPDSGRAKQ